MIFALGKAEISVQDERTLPHNNPKGYWLPRRRPGGVGLLF